ncbi:response regulator [Thermodesulforhabdus norvegica]|uniref:Response regulatory domain-containing protein n=1 Tax=Thermodesulforhabdus norvegica TaxID=39841 RepID=A0A1I4V6R0_9BACT|nr:response regulator [Thermodesulforhabdus norvegica]SFM96670.1 protein of unknown function [Thermodesulforhabdus norvegica]
MIPGKSGFSGRIENVELTQIIQMVCMSGHNVRIIVKAGDREGIVLVYGGSIFHAEAEGHQGEEAIYRMATWEGQVCEFSPLYEEPKVKTVKKDWQYVLLEAARIQDEQRIQKKIKVLIVDDSEFFVRRLKSVLDEDDELSVVGAARNGSEAVEFLKEKAVDVVVLDIFMPVMKGDTALKHIMLKFGVPVVIMSAFPRGSEATLFEFLCLGAVDVFPKPTSNEGFEWQHDLRNRLKKAARACVSRFRLIRPGRDSGEKYKTPRKMACSKIREKLTVVVGGEASHGEWFRLPLEKLSQEGILAAFSTLHAEILPLVMNLIRDKAHCGTLFHNTGDAVKIFPGSVNFFSSDRRWRFTGAAESDGWLVEPLESSTGTTDAAVELARSAIEVGIREVNMIILSGADEFPSEEVKNLVDCGVRFWIPPLDGMVFSCMAESVIRSVDSTTVGNSVILADNWDALMVKYEGETGGDQQCE